MSAGNNGPMGLIGMALAALRERRERRALERELERLARSGPHLLRDIGVDAGAPLPSEARIETGQTLGVAASVWSPPMHSPRGAADDGIQGL